MNKTTAPTPAFAAGDRVTVTTAATGGEPLAGTIETISKGWYVVELDEEIENAKGQMSTTVSARVSSLQPLVDDEQAEEEEASLQADDVEEAEEEEEEAASSRMAEALRKARTRYVKTHRPSGAATAHNGDTIAKELLDYEPLEVAEIADRCLKLPKGTHAERYAGLNNGQIRMNSGNRIRGAWKKAERDGDTDTIAHILFILGLDDQLAEEAA